MKALDFNYDYLEYHYNLAVEKAALGVAIISRMGPKMGLNEKMIESNRRTLIHSLADGLGISRSATSVDVHNAERRIPVRIWNDKRMQSILNSMKNELSQSRFLSCTP